MWNVKHVASGMARLARGMGFSLQSKTHLVYFPDTKVMVETMHCGFNEDQPAAAVVGEKNDGASATAAAGGNRFSFDVLDAAHRQELPDNDSESDLEASMEPAAM